MLTFAEAAKRGSFATAARELGLTPSAVAKSVARLETQLNVRLFHRTTRRVALTHEGEELYGRSRKILDELSELESLAAGATRGPTGVLRIDVPVTYGKQVLLPVVAEMARQYLELRFDLRLSDKHADVVGEGLDAVVRIGEIADSRLVAKLIDHQAIGVYGAVSYFKRKGQPKHPNDVATHDCVVFRFPHSGRDRPWEFSVDREPAEIRPVAKGVINDGEGLVGAALVGLGLVQVPDYMAAAAVRSGQLVEVLVKYKPKPLPISLVFPTNRQIPQRLRVLIDMLSERKRPLRRSARQ